MGWACQLQYGKMVANLLLKVAKWLRNGCEMVANFVHILCRLGEIVEFCYY